MKTSFSVFGLVLLSCFTLKAQTIPNSNFDNWTNQSYDEATNWTSSNQESIRKNVGVTSTSVTGATGKGLRMQTKIIGPDTVFGYVFYGAGGGDPMAGQGGLPYSQKPSNFIGQCRYNLPVNDTAIMLVIFKKAGVIINSNVIKIRGTGNQNSFTPFSYTLGVASSTLSPDSVIIAVASSNAIRNSGIQNNSFIEVDELNFTGAGITQTISNGSFENWTTTDFAKLNNWSAAGEGISQIAPGQSGPFAIQLQTQVYSGNFVGVTGLTNGMYPPMGGPPKGGQPYTLTKDTLFGYYKFNGTNDSGLISINLRKSGIQVFGAVKYFKNQNNWTLFKIPINASSAPDSLRLEIYSSSPPGLMSGGGSKLSVDNLYLSSQATFISTILENVSGLTLYPNPGTSSLKLKLPSGFIGDMKVYDTMGRELTLKNISYTETEMVIDILELKAGVYYVQLLNNTGSLVAKFIKE